jgi:hypothetical protein
MVTYRTYYAAERIIIPLLSEKQKKKHYEFARAHFLNNWGLGPGKYVLIHYDEKWFWAWWQDERCQGLCEELGIDPVAFKADHKRVTHQQGEIVVTVTGFAFKDTIENG